MKAMLLAAGRGERLRPVTDSLPKPLVEVAGQPLIGHHLRALARAGIREVVINLSWLPERIRAALGDGRDFGVHIHYSDEGPVPLETGGGIFHALPHLGPAPFLVVNGDIFTDIDFAALAAHVAEDVRCGVQARLVLVPNPPQHPGGDFALDGERVLERTAAAPSFTYSGVGLFMPELFAECRPGRFPLLPLLLRAIAAGKLRGGVHPGAWCDVGTPERLAALRSGVAAGG
jgi:N-acetyl-alpha-D-muramate 1-phosphate uridylyltransferase